MKTPMSNNHFNIDVTINNVNNKYINNSNLPLKVTILDLLHSIITVGKPDVYHIFRYNYYSIYDILFRIYLLMSSLNFTQKSNYINNSILFDNMDPSEKGAVNYFLGMTFSKLVASKIFNIKWLGHYSWYYHNGMVNNNSKSRSTADLIGLDVKNNEWAIFEAKGRNDHQYTSPLQKAIEQAKGIKYYVNGKKCTICIGSVLYRDKSNKNISIVLEDPEYDKESKIVNIERDARFWKEYYFYAIELHNLQSKIGKEKFSLKTGFNIYIEDIVIELYNSLPKIDKNREIPFPEPSISQDLISQASKIDAFNDGIEIKEADMPPL